MHAVRCTYQEEKDDADSRSEGPPQGKELFMFRLQLRELYQHVHGVPREYLPSGRGGC